MNQRRFHRVKFNAPGELAHYDMNYRCRLENVSLRGALISADECIMVPLGESCILSIPLEPESPPMVITVAVVHCFFSMVGVKFTGFTDDAEERLLALLKQTTPEPDILMQEWQSIQQERTAAPEEMESISSAAAS